MFTKQQLHLLASLPSSSGLNALATRALEARSCLDDARPEAFIQTKVVKNSHVLFTEEFNHPVATEITICSAKEATPEDATAIEGLIPDKDNVLFKGVFSNHDFAKAFFDKDSDFGSAGTAVMLANHRVNTEASSAHFIDSITDLVKPTQSDVFKAPLQELKSLIENSNGGSTRFKVTEVRRIKILVEALTRIARSEDHEYVSSVIHEKIKTVTQKAQYDIEERIKAVSSGLMKDNYLLEHKETTRSAIDLYADIRELLTPSIIGQIGAKTRAIQRVVSTADICMRISKNRGNDSLFGTPSTNSHQQSITLSMEHGYQVQQIVDKPVTGTVCLLEVHLTISDMMRLLQSTPLENWTPCTLNPEKLTEQRAKTGITVEEPGSTFPDSQKIDALISKISALCETKLGKKDDRIEVIELLKDLISLTSLYAQDYEKETMNHMSTFFEKEMTKHAALTEAMYEQIAETNPELNIEFAGSVLLGAKNE
ncbi:hypothetical protein AB4254_08055 [Vibrio breoganii]